MTETQIDKIPFDRLLEPLANVESGKEGDNSSPENGLWAYTAQLKDDGIASRRQEIEANNGRLVRHTIGRDKPVLDGVYEGSYGGEAIVVVYDKDPKPIDDAVEAVIKSSLDSNTGKFKKSVILKQVYEYVNSNMSYDEAAVENIFQTTGRSKNGKKISLGLYVKQGVGVCRHQALFVGAILERLNILGYIDGQVSVERNALRRKNATGADKYDGHSWARYTNSAGQVYIIDVAGERIDSLDSLIELRTNKPDEYWDYARPEDKIKAKARLAIKHALNPVDGPYTDANGVIVRTPWT